MSTHQFKPMFEVAKLAALYPELENGEPFTKIMPTLGLYADRHFLYYGHDGVATAYYENNDIAAAGPFTFDHFADHQRFIAFTEGVTDAISDIQQFLSKLKRLELDELSTDSLLDLVLENCQLEIKIWSYYNSTQPQNLAKFEEKLKKAIARTITQSSDATDAFSMLSANPELSLLEQEQRDWLKLLTSSNPKDLLQIHFNKYKTLQLGDGNWTPSINRLKTQLSLDKSLSQNQILSRLNEIETKPKTVNQNRAKLIKQLGLSEAEIYYAGVLSQIGHLRLAMRSEGFIPLAYGEDKPILDVLASRFHTDGMVFRSFTYTELKDLKNGNVPNFSDVKKRVGGPYLLVVEDGEYKTHFGEDAVSNFNKLVPDRFVQKSDVVEGNAAMSGVVEGEAVVYLWGAELPADLPDNAILVTGQTRPQLMPLIRKCVGIITDEGGLMSHAAIVARELKLPCLVGAMQATKIIKTGDTIRLDADLGEVRILKKGSVEPKPQIAIESDSPVTKVRHKPALKTVPSIQRLLMTFDEISGDQRSLVGGKGTSLAAMHRAGLPVPPGFVITTETYRKLHGHTLPKQIVQKIVAAFDSLGANRVAVRSSAVAEDSANSSWAGQFDTVLNVSRSEIENAIQLCWDSADSKIVSDYAQNNHIAKADLALGVVVQAMVDSEVSGVAFTKNPIMGNLDEIMIEACFGLGELLVQGMVTPDNFVLSHNPVTLKSSNQYPQETYLTYENGQNIELPVPDPAAEKLSPDQVLKLARIAIQVENFFGAPQDIEWALHHGDFYIVQARPITT